MRVRVSALMVRGVVASMLLMAGCDSETQTETATLTPELIAGARVHFVCGNIGFVDLGAEFDLPAYFYDERTKQIISGCGGLCMHRMDECKKTCPPPKWVAEGCDAKFERSRSSRKSSALPHRER